MSRSLFLDEGLATFMQYYWSDNLDAIRKPYCWDRPSLAAMIEIDWSNDPYFSIIFPESNIFNTSNNTRFRAHELASYLVYEIIKKNPLHTLASTWCLLKPKLREGRTHQVIKELFSINLWELDKTIWIDSSCNVKKPSTSIKLHDIALKAFADNDLETAEKWLPTARLETYLSNNLQSLKTLIYLLITLGKGKKKPVDRQLYKTEALVSIGLAESENIEQKFKDIFKAYKYVLKLSNTVHSIELRKIGTQTAKAFYELLEKYPDDPVVILAAAKCQVKSSFSFVSNETWKEKLKTVQTNSLLKDVASELIINETFS